MLWIALHLPALSLESFAATLANSGSSSIESQPIALMDAQRLVSVNAAALALGVKPGCKRATALALAPQIILGKADPSRDVLALEPIAHAALAFTPQVAIQPGEGDAAPHTVLLEVEASLRYFDGRERLQHRLLAAVQPLGHRIHCVSAPTAQGAALLARVHASLHCADLDATARALESAPVWLLGPGSEHWEALEGMGLRTLGDLRSLPRAGLARRFGEGLLLEFDRALGLEPDPREAIALPPSFASRLELFARADTTEQVLHGAALLLARLVLWLAAQHAFVRRFTLVMEHEVRWRRASDAPRSTALEIALAEPSRDPAHLLVLLRERLANLQLPAPTLDLRLHADDIVRRAAPNTELFPTARSQREGLIQLIERLQARLGAAQVQRLHKVEDHRPEFGSRSEAVTGDALPSSPVPRPSAARSAETASAALRPAAVAAEVARSASGSSAVVPSVSSSAPASSAASSTSASSTRVTASLPSTTAPARSASSRAKALRTSTARSAVKRPPGLTGVPLPPKASAPSLDATEKAVEPAPSASKRKPLRAPVIPSAPTPRPVWLLPEPEPLPERHSRPLLAGEPLQLLSGPERIEAGWWDTALAERDYFIAQAADGALVWIYRARLPISASGEVQGWFMQGRFG